MKVHVGVKSDPVEGRYSLDWLFGIMREQGVERLQYGSSTAALLVDDAYLRRLRREAAGRGISVTSLFSATREFGGYGSGDPLLAAATRRFWERLIRVASQLGASSAGTNACIVMRDRPDLREQGIRRFFQDARELMRIARKAGLAALTTEPMSSLWEFPSTPQEILRLTAELDAFHAGNAGDTVPFLLCGDISHGVADAEGRVIHDNWGLFEMQIPWMREFHFKNTDGIFNATFGFGGEERGRGIVDLARVAEILRRNAERFPVSELTGYLEIPGPKVGRDYTDRLLGEMLSRSLETLRAFFPE